MMQQIEKVDFRARKWLSVKIWPLKNFFFVKIDFFHFIFANWVIWNKKKSKKIFDFFGFFRIFSKCQNLTTGNFFFRQNSSKSTFFTLFSRIEWFGTKEGKKNFFDFFRFFRFFSHFWTPKKPKISILRIFPDMRSFPEARRRLVLSFSTISEKSLDPINLNSF